MQYMSDIIAGVFGLAIALIEIRSARDRKRTEQRAAIRAKEALLSMKMHDATLELSYATALAVEQHQLNGEMKTAKEKAIKAKEAYDDFIKDVASEQTTAV